MTMLESKKAFEDALFDQKHLTYDAMMNGYVAIQNFLARCDSDNNLVDKIASFFEKEENWEALRNCWLENDRSDDLRALLRKSLKG